ncbi:cytochrome P450 [Streptomyces sp. NBC_01239]|uniref:cytochrome P450 n=1 Tax=Streptomyces sp. NBC_01239 TaxID=2903792 RepID=UPI0022584030|nr:cytochrome P450 [Streptomyces sp. NBC_01239]MCX4812169.1 cytochrome P450 [Streptomyces sp. NBC_01239]
MTATTLDALNLPAPYGGCPFDPPPAYSAAAREAAVSRATLPDGTACWLVTGYDEVRAVLADARFSADARTPGFPFLSAGQRELATAKPSFIRMDDPEHARLRRMVTKDFLVKRIEELRPGIQDIVDRAVDRMTEGRDSADLVADFALPIPSLVICLMLGVPYEDHDLFQSLSRTLLDNRTSRPEAERAHAELMGYLAQLAERKRREPADDILSRLAARDDLTDQETASLGFLLLVTGHESTANMTAVSVLALLRRPDQAELLREQPELVRGAVEELLRHLTIIHLGLGRAATETVRVGEVTIPAGEGVICMLSTANRDERLFSSGADFDLTRDARRHVAFGYGIHQCLGQTLARVELQIILTTLLRRLPALRLAAPADQLTYNQDAIVYGLRELPVTWAW